MDHAAICIAGEPLEIRTINVKSRRDYNVIILGAGPAGMFCALKLLALGIGDILIVEMGKAIDQRRRKGKDIISGWGGAGAFSDGKLTLSPEVGGFLGEYLDRGTLQRLLEEADAMYLKFGAPNEIYCSPSDALDDLKREARHAGMELVPSRVRHLGTENCLRVIAGVKDFLESRVTILTETRIDRILVDRGAITGVMTDSGEAMRGRCVVACPGRIGAQWMREEAMRLGLRSRPNPVDIGVRIETQASILTKLTDACYEAKLVAYSRTFEDKIRTFCMNPYGEVVVEEVDGLATVNGHSYSEKKTENTNFALLVSSSFTEPFDDPIRFGRNVAALANMLGRGVIVQRLGDLLHGRRTNSERLSRSTTRPTLESAAPGDLSFVLPYRLLKSVMEMLEAMDQLTPGIYARDTLLYGVEVKFYSNRIFLSPELETEIPGLFAIGDGAGITRGLLQASASGLRAGEIIAERAGKKAESDQD